MHHRTLLPLSLLAHALVAQKCPDPVDPLLVVQPHAIATILDARSDNTSATAIADFVRHHVEPTLGVGHDLAPLGDALLVCRGLPQQQAWIERFLAELRVRPPKTTSIRVEMLRVPTAVFRQVLAKHMAPLAGVAELQEDRDTEFRPVPATHLADAPVEWLRDLPTIPGIEILESPALRRQPELSRHSISVLRNHSFVRDRRVELLNDKVTLEAIEDVVRSGIILSGRSAVLPDGRVAVDLSVHLLELHDLGNEAVVIAGCETQIQRPSTTHWRVTDHIAIRAGDVTAYSIPLGDATADHLVLLVRATVDDGP